MVNLSIIEQKNSNHSLHKYRDLHALNSSYLLNVMLRFTFKKNAKENSSYKFYTNLKAMYMKSS